MNLEILKKWEEKKNEGLEPLNRIYFLSTFTANIIEPYLGMQLEQIGKPLDITFGPYNQIVQQLMDEKSPVYSESTEYTAIWIRMEDIVGSKLIEGCQDLQVYLEDTKTMCESVLSAAKAAYGKIIFVLPVKIGKRPAGLGDLQIAEGMEHLSELIRSTFISCLSGQKGILICDAEETIREISLEQAMDPTMYALAKVPYTELFFEKISEQIRKVIHMSHSSSRVLLFDAAMLLAEEYDAAGYWDQVSEILESEIGRDDTTRDLQEYIKILAAWGIDIALATALSQDEFNRILSGEDIMLELESIKYICHSCQSIVEAVEKISAWQYIDAHSIVIVTPRSCDSEELNSDILKLPEDRAIWAEAINKSEYISHIPKTAPRKSELKSNSKADFFTSLDLQVALHEAVREQSKQVLHLIESVGDFRLTNIQWGEKELECAFDSNDTRILSVYVKDRFGDYGMSGLIIGKVTNHVFQLEDFMLNCRILGKQTEYQVMSRLAAYTESLGCNEISMKYIKNNRNYIGGKFMAEMLGVDFDKVRTGNEFTADCDEIKRRAAGKIAVHPVLLKDEKSTNLQKSASELLSSRWQMKNARMKNRILGYAASIRNVDHIMNEINASYRHSHAVSCEYVAPRTETEKKLVKLWSEILHIDKVGVLDNFFVVGGTSILATQLIVKFKEAFGIEMPVRIFFDKSNIEQIALYIDALESRHDKEALNEGDIENYRLNTREFLRREVVLDESIKAEGLLPSKSAEESKNVLLTGATGFLGAFLLSDLLNKTSYKVFCLVRSKDEESGMGRIKDNLSKYEIWKDEFEDRIVVVCGNLALPLLGLSNKKFMELAEHIDMIYHCGANTNFLEPYQLLKAENVGGTQEILRLAAKVRLKIVHFVSTHYVFSTISNEPGSLKYEDEIPSCNEIVVMGYQQTKLICEQIIKLARERGLLVSIYRPGRISGSSETGACQTRDFVWLMSKCCVESGVMFEEETNIELIPVDYVSSAIIELSKEAVAVNRNFHIINCYRTPIRYIAQWMDERGFKVEKYPYMEWKDKLTERVQKNQGLNSIGTMLPFITEDATVIDKSLILDTRNADEILDSKGVARKEVDKELFEKYLDYFIKIGFFNMAS
jgi:thioester reductase-like protein/FkbH-like protein